MRRAATLDDTTSVPISGNTATFSQNFRNSSLTASGFSRCSDHQQSAESISFCARVTRIESPKHLGRICEGIAPIGFDDARFELALGAFVQLASVVFDDQYGHGGPIRERCEARVAIDPS